MIILDTTLRNYVTWFITT